MKDMENTLVRAGQLVAFESGEYSDRSTAGFLVALVEFDLKKEHSLFSIEEEKQDCGSSGEHFLPFLVRKGYLMDVSFKTVHMGSYGDIELTIYG